MGLKLSAEERHPVVAGLIALAAVGVALGLVAGVIALVASGVFGVGGGSSDDTQVADQGASLYLPTPRPTQSQSGPLITLSPEALTDESSAPVDRSTEAPAQAEIGIVLSVGSGSVDPMERIDLTGVYTGGEGAVLQVQRLEGGDWTDFPVSAGVSGEQFSTYVQTGRQGKQEWRVVDPDTQRVSNVVTVTVR